MSPDSTPGDWYIVVTCAACQSTIFLFRDLTDGKGSLGALYHEKCPGCGHEAEYSARHYQQPGDGN